MSSLSIGISKRDILTFLFKWKATILVWTLFTIAAVSVLSYLVPQPYRATAQVIVERNRTPTLRSSFAPGLESLEVMNTEIAIIRSRPVMSAVVDELAAYDVPASTSRLKQFINRVRSWLDEVGLLTRLSPRQGQIEGLLRSVKAEPVINANVIDIWYYHDDPEWAARVVNAVTDQYISRHLDIYSSQGVTNFYEVQVQAAEKEYDRLTRELLQYKQRESISAVTDRRAQMVRELSTLREKLAEVGAERAELLTRYEPTHEQVVLTQRRLASARASERELQRGLEELEQQQSTIESLEVQIRSQKDLLLELKQSYEQARLNAASNVDTINVHLLESAVPPAKPRFPRLLFVVLSIPFGFALALCVALLREYMDHRVNDPDSAEMALDLPCLGSIPRLGLFSRHRSG